MIELEKVYIEGELDITSFLPSGEKTYYISYKTNGIVIYNQCYFKFPNANAVFEKLTVGNTYRISFRKIFVEKNDDQYWCFIHSVQGELKIDEI